MMQPAPGQALKIPPWLTGLILLTWLVTMGFLVRTELLFGSTSKDVRALVDEAGIKKHAATATYGFHFGELRVGELETAVSGGQREDQLLYLLDGRVTTPLPGRLKGTATASWDRRPRGAILDIEIAGARHRIDAKVGEADDGVRLLHVTHASPTGENVHQWPLPADLQLVEGPLPLPRAAAVSFPESGEAQDPVTGAPTEWTRRETSVPDFEIADRQFSATRHELDLGEHRLEAWIAEGGLLLKASLPFGLSLTLEDFSKGALGS
ncbi:MAG: hypothetical protein AAF533_12670 [Acidobacteriota bacterium]